MLFIYSPISGPRIRYTFNLLLRELLGIDFRLIDTIDEFDLLDGPKLEYSTVKKTNAPYIASAGLLESSVIEHVNPNYAFENGTHLLFTFQDKTSELPFDPFAATFYIVSRYEEYLPFADDGWGRFEAAQSCAYSHGFLQLPVVHYWADILSQFLSKRCGIESCSISKYSFVPTYDIDIAFSYLYKGLIRTTGAVCQSLFSGEFKEIRERFRVLKGKTQDPYDSYTLQFALHEKYGLKPKYFIHPGTWGQYDKNIKPTHPKFKNLLHRILEVAEIGLHPSWKSTLDSSLIRKEKNLLEEALGKTVTSCRQHFIRIRMPDTYQNYLNAGFLDDYSMGFASDNGFRAGICVPYYFYNLRKETETLLKIHPLAMMDGALKNYLKLQPETAIHSIRPIINEIKKVGGTFISLFHNDTLGSSPIWEGWANVYTQMILEALSVNTNNHKKYD